MPTVETVGPSRPPAQAAKLADAAAIKAKRFMMESCNGRPPLPQSLNRPRMRLFAP